MPDDSKPLVLVVDDDPEAAALVARWLELADLDVQVHASGESLLEALKTTLPDVICLDLGLPGISGLGVLQVVRQRHLTVPVVVLTGDASAQSVVAAMGDGAYDYLTKPAERTKLTTVVRNAAAHYRDSTRLAQLEREASGHGFAGILGNSPAMSRVFRQLQKIAASDITVLIHGESGTGKELVAHAVHDHSARGGGPFVAVNCAAVPETLQDSEFFGHEKGAFTGAAKTKAGRFEEADGGTLFLDEVAELSPSLQAKLLRVLQERQFCRVGGSRTLSSDFRLVTASHRDLEAMVKEGTFRGDLYFRLAVLELELPPLREREDDLWLLVDAFLQEFGSEDGLRVGPSARRTLSRYEWPGNVRELRNVLQRASVLCEENTIRLGDLPKRLIGEEPTREPSAPQLPDLDALNMTLDDLERWAIVTTLERTGGHLTEAVRILGIGRTTLYRKLKKYKIDTP